jgi:sodium-dependent dicarboxylate transporter 2/3/5
VVAFLLPIGIGFAEPLGIQVHLAYLVAIAAGLVYIFPTGAPPMAIVYSSRYLRIRDLLVSGAVLHVVSWAVILLWARYYWPLVGLP